MAIKVEYQTERQVDTIRQRQANQEAKELLAQLDERIALLEALKEESK